jgi:hypothetical protein
VNNPRSKKGQQTWLAVAVFLALVLAGCAGIGEGPPGGGSSGSSSGSGTGGGGGATGTLVLFAEDQAADNVLAFELTLSSVTISDSGGTATPLLAGAVPLEWRSRGLAPTLLSVTSLPAGTYTQISLTVSPPEMTVFDLIGGSASEVTPPLSVSSVDLPTSLVLAGGEVLGVRLDFDLRSSVQLDINSNFIIAPTFGVVPTSFVVGQLRGDLDDVLASVIGVDAANNQVTVSVLASGQTLTANVDASTLFGGVAGLSDLQVGDNIEIDARLQSGGSFLAQGIEREVAGAVQQVRGLILDRTPAVGDTTSLTLLVVETAPSSGTLAPGDQVAVTIDANTGFRIAAEDLPAAIFPNLDFDRQTLQPGQFVHAVQGVGTGFVADFLTLEETYLVGQVGLGVGANSFDFLPEGDFFTQNGLASMNVATSSTQTELENMPAGLGSLQPNLSIVAVRGVLVFQGGNGVLVAKRVRLLQ